MSETKKNFLAVGVLTGIILFGVLGFGMAVSEHGSMMFGCPFLMGEHGLCGTSATDHVEMWESAFLGKISPLDFVFLLAMVALVFRVVLEISPPIQKFFLYFQKQRKIFLLWRKIMETLRLGILQRKLYA